MKKKVVPIVTLSILGVSFICSIFPAIAIGNRTFMNGKSLANISVFLDNDDKIHGTYWKEHNSVYFEDSDNAIKNYLKEITFEDDNNKFPYDYHGNTAYSTYVLYCNNRSFRINDELTKCTIEYKDKGNHFSAVMEYNLKNCDGNHLLELISNAKEIRS